MLPPWISSKQSALNIVLIFYPLLKCVKWPYMNFTLAQIGLFIESSILHILLSTLRSDIDFW